jgi:hypothetical protein
MVVSVRVTMALLLIALLPYTLTVLTIVVLWFDEQFDAIVRAILART